jgi:hypothetical protein|tara:strand:- start:215 stop:391 length:177 start_codon:yes stop_codon:yes gene_type:complete
MNSEENKAMLIEMACHNLIETADYVIEEHKHHPEVIKPWKEALLAATAKLVHEIGGMQ